MGAKRTAEFQFEPLDVTKRQIRIVELHPGQQHDPVTCTILTVGLPEQNPYETVSYCWGDGPMRSKCLVNGHTISVPLSSANILRQARHVSKPRYLWIDALCINQSDILERNEQVALMREIYSSSSGNLIFLDVPPGQAPGSYELFQRLWSEARMFTSDFADMDAVIGQVADSKDTLTKLETTAYLAVAFSPWFRRVWVMQEAALAPSNACYIATYQMPLVDLLRAFRWRQHKYHLFTDMPINAMDVNTALRSILTLWRYVDPWHGPYRKQHGASIADALVFGRGLRSTQPQDHVFGLLGLIRYQSLPQAIMSRLQPVYTRSILDIFRDATVAAFMEDNGIPDFIFEEIVCQPDELSASGGRQDWPSWVPDWSLARDLGVHPGRLNKWWFSASGRLPYAFAELDFGTIQLRGVQMDTVARTTSVCRAMDWHKQEKNRDILAWLDEVDKLAPTSPLPSRAKVREIVNSVLLAGLNSDLRPLQSSDLESFESARDQIAGENDNAGIDSRPILEVFEKTCNNRRFFRTNKRYLGIGPGNMQAGDVLVVLSGCRAPILLRSHQEDGSYTIVGESYVHGIMQGEGIRESGESCRMLTIK